MKQVKLPGLERDQRSFRPAFDYCESMMLGRKCRCFRPAQFPSSRQQDRFNGYCQYWITAWGSSKEQRKIRNRQEVSIHDVGICPLKLAQRDR